MSGEILFIAHRIPFPPDRGDKIRSHHILKRLARSAPVHVACFADDELDLAEEVELASIARSYRLVRRAKPLMLAGMQALGAGMPVSLTAFYYAALASFIRDLIAQGRIGTIYVFSGQMGQYIPADFAGRVIVDFVDVDSAKFEAYAAMKSGPMRWVDGREARLLRGEEARLAARADVSLLVSHREVDLFRRRLTAAERDRADVRVLGNGIDSDHYDPGVVCPAPQMRDLPGPRLIFTGQMDYPPNVAAALRAAHRILPLVRAVLPDAGLHIVGRRPTDELRALHGQAGVHVWGRVDDIRPWLKAADMALIPLEIARGVQNKVLEAMAMELPVVLTGAAATGIDAQPGVHFAVRDRDADLADAVIALACDARRARVKALRARRFVLQQQSWRSALAPLAEIIAGPTQRPAQGRRDAA